MHDIRYKREREIEKDGEEHAKMKYTFVDTPNQVFFIKIMLLLNRVQHSSDKHFVKFKMNNRNERSTKAQ